MKIRTEFLRYLRSKKIAVVTYSRHCSFNGVHVYFDDEFQRCRFYAPGITSVIPEYNFTTPKAVLDKFYHFCYSVGNKTSLITINLQNENSFFNQKRA